MPPAHEEVDRIKERSDAAPEMPFLTILIKRSVPEHCFTRSRPALFLYMLMQHSAAFVVPDETKCADPVAVDH